jgi:hypothetical protein
MARSRRSAATKLPVNVVELDQRLAKLRSAVPDGKYYALTVTAGEQGEIEWSTQTHWAGYHDEARRIELRQPRLVLPAFVMFWEEHRQPYAIINRVAELPLFLLGGGNALILKSVAESELQEFLKPDPAVADAFGGFKSLSFCEPSAFKHAPTSKLRMSVLRRDNRRCRICGRRPDDHVDVELHVHHIRPWAKGGLTEITNLITLCHTCHKGLEPHEDPTLYQYVDQRFKSVDANKELEAFLAGVARYRSRMYAMVVPSERPEE